MSIFMIMLAVYGTVAVLVLIAAIPLSSQEPTAHGRDTLFAFAVALAVLWPMGLLWYSFVAIYFAAAWTISRLAQWVRRA